MVSKAVECVGQCCIHILIICMFVMGTKSTFVLRKTCSAKAAWARCDSSPLNCSPGPIQMQCKCRMSHLALTVPGIKHTRFCFVSAAANGPWLSVSAAGGCQGSSSDILVTLQQPLRPSEWHFLGGNTIGGDSACESWNYLSFILQHY